MSQIIPFSNATLPAYLAKRSDIVSAINRDVVSSGPNFPVLSIKGKVFTLVKDGQRKVLTRPDETGDEVAVQSLNVSVVRANTKARVFYAKAYSEEDSEGAKPDCYSSDGVAPASDARNPQAKKCATCQHAVWGSKAGADGKGTACSVNTRLAITDPDKLEEPYLLRVPAGSRKDFAEVVKLAESRGVPYNALVLKVSFDMAAPAPKLMFKILGLLDEQQYAKASDYYEDETVKEIVGLSAPKPAVEDHEESTPAVGADELDAALAARAVTAKASETAKTKPAKPAPAPVVDEDEIEAVVAPPAPVVEKPKAKPVAKAKPAVEEGDDLLGDLDELLSSTDD